MGHASALIWLNGGANLAYAVERELFQHGYLTHVIAAQTDGNVLLEVAQNLMAAGLITICAADFLYEVERDRAQALIGPSRFLDLDAARFNTPEEAAVEIAKNLAEKGIVPSKR